MPGLGATSSSTRPLAAQQAVDLDIRGFTLRHPPLAQQTFLGETESLDEPPSGSVKTQGRAVIVMLMRWVPGSGGALGERMLDASIGLKPEHPRRDDRLRKPPVCDRRHQENAAVQRRRNRREVVLSHPARRERKQREPQQEVQVRPRAPRR